MASQEGRPGGALPVLFRPFQLPIELPSGPKVRGRLIEGIRRRGGVFRDSTSGSDLVVDIAATKILSFPTLGRLRFEVRARGSESWMVLVHFVSIRLFYLLLTVPLGLLALFSLVTGSQTRGSLVALLCFFIGAHILGAATKFRRSGEIRDFIDEVLGTIPNETVYVESTGPTWKPSVRPTHLRRGAWMPRFYRRLFIATMHRCPSVLRKTSANGIDIVWAITILSILLSVSAVAIRLAVGVILGVPPTLTGILSKLALAFVVGVGIHSYYFLHRDFLDRCIGEYAREDRGNSPRK